jgi:hypothetical protein
MAASQVSVENTRFLNVDLDIYSRSNLQPILDALGREVVVLHAGRVVGKRTYEAHIELSGTAKDANKTIRAFCTSIESLRGEARRLWDTALVRDFNVGVQAEVRPHCYGLAIAAETVKATSKLNARIVVSIYAPEPKPRRVRPLLGS